MGRSVAFLCLKHDKVADAATLPYALYKAHKLQYYKAGSARIAKFLYDSLTKLLKIQRKTRD